MSLPSLKWAASPNFRAGRAGQKLDLIVVHRCEGSGPGTVAYFQTRAADVSAQFVVGEKGAWITQMVHVADTAWHACAFNGRSVGIEPAGYSKDGFDDGLLSTLAELVAYLCHYLQIPVRHARGKNRPWMHDPKGRDASLDFAPLKGSKIGELTAKWDIVSGLQPRGLRRSGQGHSAF